MQTYAARAWFLAGECGEWPPKKARDAKEERGFCGVILARTPVVMRSAVLYCFKLRPNPSHQTMALYKQALCRSFAPLLKASGFTKKSSTWFKKTEEVIFVFNIQTSNWSEYYHFNAGIYIRELGLLESPPLHKCHIHTRLPDRKYHSVEAAVRSHELADFTGRPIDPHVRSLELAQIVFPLAVDWFERFESRASVKKELSTIGHPWFFVTKDVWPLLGVKMAM